MIIRGPGFRRVKALAGLGGGLFGQGLDRRARLALGMAEKEGGLVPDGVGHLTVVRDDSHERGREAQEVLACRGKSQMRALAFSGTLGAVNDGTNIRLRGMHSDDLDKGIGSG